MWYTAWECPYSEFFLSVFSHIWTEYIRAECGKIRTRKTLNTNIFHGVLIMWLNSKIFCSCQVFSYLILGILAKTDIKRWRDTTLQWWNRIKNSVIKLQKEIRKILIDITVWRSHTVYPARQQSTWNLQEMSKTKNSWYMKNQAGHRSMLFCQIFICCEQSSTYFMCFFWHQVEVDNFDSLDSLQTSVGTSNLF